MKASHAAAGRHVFSGPPYRPEGHASYQEKADGDVQGH